jgi:hypothetical protein
MKSPEIAGCLVLLVIAIVLAGCTQPGGGTSPVTSPSQTIIPVSATISIPPTPATQTFTGTQTVEVPTKITITTTIAPVQSFAVVQVQATPENPGTVTYTRFNDENFRLEYPSSWNYSETSRQLRESIENGTLCIASVSSFLNERLQTFQSRDRTITFSAWTVDMGSVPVQATDTKKYRAYINMILNDESLCGVPVKGNVNIAGSSPVSPGSGTLSAQKVDFSILNDVGVSQGMGTAYFVKGLHHNGIFIAYVKGTGFDTWRPVTDHLFNSLVFGAGF